MLTYYYMKKIFINNIKQQNGLKHFLSFFYLILSYVGNIGAWL